MRMVQVRLGTAVASFALAFGSVTGPKSAYASTTQPNSEAHASPSPTPTENPQSVLKKADTPTTPSLPLPAGLTVREAHFPLWAELGGSGLGLAGIVSGSILLALDGTPGEGGGKRVNRYHGTAFLVSGAQLLALSLIFLAIDRWPRQTYTGPKLGKARRVRGLRIRF